MEKVSKFWDSLPKEVKVSCFILASYLLSEVAAPYLGKTDSRVAMFAANLALVFGAQAKNRLERYKANRKENG